MKRVTLADLSKEDKAKIGYLYEQWLREKEEKEEILENYNLEKERFEQVIDLLQNQRQQEERIKQKCDEINDDLRRRKSGDENESYNPIPFPIQVNSNGKDNQLTPAHNFDAFHSPRMGNASKKSEFASPVECFGKVFNDINLIKGELNQMQNNIKNLVFSPERSADRYTKTSRSPTPHKTPELTMNDLKTDKNKRRKKEVPVVSDSSEDENSQSKCCTHCKTMKLKQSQNDRKVYDNLKRSQHYKKKAIHQLDKELGLKSNYIKKKHELSLRKGANCHTTSCLDKQTFTNKLKTMYRKAAQKSLKMAEKYCPKAPVKPNNSYFVENTHPNNIAAKYPSVTQIGNPGLSLPPSAPLPYAHAYYSGAQDSVLLCPLDDTSIDKTAGNRYDESLFNIINDMEHRGDQPERL